MRSASLPTWPGPRLRRRMLSEFLTAWTHGRAPMDHDSVALARENTERHKECEEAAPCARTDGGGHDGDDVDRGPDTTQLLSTLRATRAISAVARTAQTR